MTANRPLPAPPYPAFIEITEGGRAVKIPIQPVDVDVRSLDQMPLDVKLLGASDLLMSASDAEFRAAVLLWCRSWHQVPAASLPNDEGKLAWMAGFGRDMRAWKRVREGALRGFREASDGRLYHPVVAAFALRAFRNLRSMSRNSQRRWEKTHPVEKLEGDGMPPDEPPAKPPKSERKAVAGPKGNVGEGRGGESSKPPLAPLPDQAVLEASWRIDFVTWYTAYPKRVGRGQAERAYLTARRRGVDAKTLLEGAERYLGSRGDGDKRWMKNPATWLNGQCWLDEQHRASDGQFEIDPGADERTALQWRLRLQAWRAGSKWQAEAYGCDPPPSPQFFRRCPPEVAAEFGLAPSSTQ